MSPRAFARAVRRTQGAWGARIIIKLDAAHPRLPQNYSFEAGSHVIGPRSRARQAKRWLRHNRALHGKWRRVVLSCTFCPGRCQDLAIWPLGPAGSHGDSHAKPKGPERSCRCRKRTQLYWHQHDGHGSPPCLQSRHQMLPCGARVVPASVPCVRNQRAPWGDTHMAGDDRKRWGTFAGASTAFPCEPNTAKRVPGLHSALLCALVEPQFASCHMLIDPAWADVSLLQPQ